MQFSSRFQIRQGLTLVEVVAGLALMATILVAMLELKARFTHQLASSNQQLRAVAVADALLDQWWADRAGFPVNRSGSIAQYPGFTWQTHVVANDVVSHLRSRVVRLDIQQDSRIITSVDLLLPLERTHAK